MARVNSLSITGSGDDDTLIVTENATGGLPKFAGMPASAAQTRRSTPPA